MTTTPNALVFAALVSAIGLSASRAEARFNDEEKAALVAAMKELLPKEQGAAAKVTLGGVEYTVSRFRSGDNGAFQVSSRNRGAHGWIFDDSVLASPPSKGWHPRYEGVAKGIVRRNAGQSIDKTIMDVDKWITTDGARAVVGYRQRRDPATHQFQTIDAVTRVLLGPGPRRKSFVTYFLDAAGRPTRFYFKGKDIVTQHLRAFPKTVREAIAKSAPGQRPASSFHWE